MSGAVKCANRWCYRPEHGPCDAEPPVRPALAPPPHPLNPRCFYCGVQLLRSRVALRLSPNARTMDHKVPTARGGPNTASNKVPACNSCNQQKAALTVDEFRAALRVRYPEWSGTFYGEGEKKGGVSLPFAPTPSTAATPHAPQ